MALPNVGTYKYMPTLCNTNGFVVTCPFSERRLDCGEKSTFETQVSSVLSRNSLPIDSCFNPIRKFCSQVGRSFPDEVVILPRVKVGRIEMVLATREDDGAAQRHGVSCLEVDATFMHRKIGYHELALPNLGNDFIADFLVVMFFVYS